MFIYFYNYEYRQSLGGGAAQVAHLTLRAQIEDENSPWSALEGVNVRSIAFCGPMTTVLIDNKDASPETEAFVEDLWDNSCNFVYKNDVVPRGYGYLSFIQDFINDAQEDLSKGTPVPSASKTIFQNHFNFKKIAKDAGLRAVEGGARSAASEAVTYAAGKVAGNEELLRLFGVLSQYIHVGNVIYYENEDAKPLVLKDMGAFHKNTAKETDLFRCIEYKKDDHPLEEFMGWHMDIIRGPGLSYPEAELS